MLGASKLARVFLRSCALALLISYPFALLPPGAADQPYGVRVPTALILGLIALTVIVRCPFSLPRWMGWCLAVFGLCAVANFATWGGPWTGYTLVLAQVAIPLAVAIVYTGYDVASEKTVVRFLVLLWALEVTYCLIAQLQGRPPVALCGNRNWEAALLVALLPWPCYAAQQRFGTRGVWLWAVTALPLTGFLIYYCHSRAANLAGLCVLVLLALLFGGKKILAMRREGKAGRALALVVGFLALTAGVSWKVLDRMLVRDIDWAVRQVQHDVRIPMYAATFRMIGAHDAILSRWSEPLKLTDRHGWLGAGAGRFRQAFAPYRSRSTYHQRSVSAPITEHPHNEWLHIMAQIGWPAGLAWLILIGSIIPALLSGGIRRIAAISAFVLYAHGHLDMVLVRAPTDILAWICLGLVWAPWIREGRVDGRQAEHVRRALYSVAMLAVYWGGTSQLYKSVRLSWLLRDAQIFEMRCVQNPKLFPELADRYEAAAKIDDSALEPHLYAGIVCLERLRDSHRALPHFVHVVEHEPHFAHVNALLGRTLGSLGEHAQATKYFAVDCWLYPGQPRPLLDYYTALAIGGRTAELPAVMAEYRKAVLNTAASHYVGEQLAQAWLVAVRAGDIAGALTAARQLCEGQDLQRVDPVLHYILADDPLLPQFMTGGFSIADFAFWKRVVTAVDLFDCEVPEDCFDQIDDRFPELSGDDRTDLVAAVLERHCQVVWLEKPATYLLQTDAAALQTLAGESVTTPPEAQCMLHPQVFLSRNVSLGIVLEEYGIAAGKAFSTLPSSRLAGVVPEASLKALAARCWLPPHQQIRAAIKAAKRH